MLFEQLHSGDLSLVKLLEELDFRTIVFVTEWLPNNT